MGPSPDGRPRHRRSLPGPWRWRGGARLVWLSVSLGLAAGALNACGQRTAEPTPVPVAVLGEVVNAVMLSSGSTSTAAQAGAGLPAWTTVTTAEQSTARLDFLAGNSLWLAPLTSVTPLYLRVGSDADPTAGVYLTRGGFAAGMLDSRLVVKTDMGDVMLTRAIAVVDFMPNSAHSQDDTLSITCLVGTCDLQGYRVARTLVSFQQLSLTNGGEDVYLAEVPASYLDRLLGAELAGLNVAPTLTALAPVRPSDTPSPAASDTPAPTAFPTATQTRLGSPSPSPSVVPSSTPTPTATQTRRPATRQPPRPTGTPTLAPSPVPATAVPSDTPLLDTPRPPPPLATGTSVPPLLLTETPIPSPLPTDTAEPPTKTPEPPTKTPGP